MSAQGSIEELPFARGLPVLGHALDLRRDPCAFVMRLARLHGGAVRFRALNRELVAIDDPAFARHVLQEKVDSFPRSFHYREARSVLGEGLLAQEGEHWHWARRMMQPAFRSDPVREVATATARCWTRVRDRWNAVAARGDSIDARLDLTRLALDGITAALCGIEPGLEEADRFGQLVRDTLLEIRKRNNAVVRLPAWMPTGRQKVVRRTIDAFEAFLGPVVDARMRDPEGRDILSALVRARDADGKGFTRSELLDQTKTLFGAGFETTATGLTWALCEVMDQPGLCDAIGEEARAAGIEGEVSGAALEKLALAKRVIEETLRLNPPVYTLGREVVADEVYEGRRIPKGSTLLISIWGMHRSAVWGPDAERFDPDRWLPEREPPRRAYMPFAAGRHTCIGMYFALVEMQVALALICRDFRIRWAPGASRPPMRPQITAAPNGPVSMVLERR
ncbi:MAG: cytochrome P450 [Phycisphaerales bacterium]